MRNEKKKQVIIFHWRVSQQTLALGYALKHYFKMEEYVF